MNRNAVSRLQRSPTVTGEDIELSIRREMSLSAEDSLKLGGNTDLIRPKLYTDTA